MRQRSQAALFAFASALSVAMLSGDAFAFDAKRAPNGAPVRWNASRVDFALSPTLDDIGSGTRGATPSASTTSRATKISGAPRPTSVALGRPLEVTLDPQNPERLALLPE